ncbi:MAG TPA: hypothetical protein VFP04_01470 [Nitrospira sp.]|nr:hypothetical protein [Nitrospira sp.]
MADRKHPQNAFPNTSNIVQDILTQLALLIRLERKMLWIIASYAVAIGMFMLCVPIAVQELVSTFSFAIQPMMIFTLTVVVGSRRDDRDRRYVGRAGPAHGRLVCRRGTPRRQSLVEHGHAGAPDGPYVLRFRRLP